MSCGVVASEAKKTKRLADKNSTSNGMPAALSLSAAADTSAIAKEKSARMPEQQKLESHIVMALKKCRGEPPFDKPTSFDLNVKIEATSENIQLISPAAQITTNRGGVAQGSNCKS